MNSHKTVERCEAMVSRSCAKYISDINLCEYGSHIGVVPTLRYILKLYIAIPVKYVMIVERPYATDIHGKVFSAMSYDATKSKVTPSVLGVSTDVSSVTGMDVNLVIDWFRESWRYLRAGIVLLNVTCVERFDSPRSAVEKAAFQRLLRDILLVSSIISSEPVRIVPMGKPAEYTVGAVLSSMGSYKSSIKKHRYPNPAIVSHTPGCDKMSLGFTLGCPGTSRIICNAILRSQTFHQLQESDFNIAMSSLSSDLENAVNAVASSTDALDKIFANLRVDKSDLNACEVLAAWKRDVLRHHEVMMRFMATMVIDESKVKDVSGRAAEWGNREKFKRTTGSVVTSSQVSTPPTKRVPLEVEKVPQAITLESDDEAPAPSTSSRPSSQKVRRVVRRNVSKPVGKSPSVSGTPTVEPVVLQAQVAVSPIDKPVPATPTPITTRPTKVVISGGKHKATNDVMSLSMDQCNALVSLEYTLSDGYFPQHSHRLQTIRSVLKTKSSADGWIKGFCKSVQIDVDADLNVDIALGNEEPDGSCDRDSMATKKYLDST